MYEDANWNLIPEHCREGLQLYIEHGVPTGSFLEAVLCNDLREAFARADDINSYHVRDYVKFLYCWAPAPCWGSPEKYHAWLANGGLKGRSNAA